MRLYPKMLLLAAILGLLLSNAALAARVENVIVRGNVRSNERLIRATSGISQGEEIGPALIQQAIRNIYALGVFSEVNLLGETTGVNTLNVIIEVKEYPILNQLTITGEDEIKESDIREKIRILPGQIVSPHAVTRAVEEVLTAYREKGYYLATVDPRQIELEGGRVDLDFVIDERERVQVKNIRFHGNESLPSKKLLDQMETKEDRWWRSADFDDEKYREDKEKILTFYRTQGFREATIVRDSVSVGDSGKDLYIDIWVEEGDRYRYGSISWNGNELISDQQIHRLLDLQEGDVYNREAFNEAVFRLASAYQEQGYWAVSIDPIETPTGNSVDVAFSIFEGEPSKVRFIDVVGNDKTKDKVIRREMALIPGDTFRRSDLERSHRNVFYLNFFENVEPDIKPLPSGDVDVIVSVTEKPTGTVNMAVGYGLSLIHISEPTRPY